MWWCTDLSIPGGEWRMFDGVAARRTRVSAAADAEPAVEQTEGMTTWLHLSLPSSAVTVISAIIQCYQHHQFKTDVSPAILSRGFVVQLYRATKSQVWHAVLHTATLSHKQELTNQSLPYFCNKVAQNRALLCSKKELRDCWEVARHAMSHLRFCRAIKLHNKITRLNCRCDIGLMFA